MASSLQNAKVFSTWTMCGPLWRTDLPRVSPPASPVRNINGACLLWHLSIESLKMIPINGFFSDSGVCNQEIPNYSRHKLIVQQLCRELCTASICSELMHLQRNHRQPIFVSACCPSWTAGSSWLTRKTKSYCNARPLRLSGHELCCAYDPAYHRRWSSRGLGRNHGKAGWNQRHHP